MCWREIFNPNENNRRIDTEAEGLPVPTDGVQDPVSRSHWLNEKILPQLEEECETHYGYKVVDASLRIMPDIAGLAFGDPNMKVIVMSRNPMATYFSNCTCMMDQCWTRSLEEGPLKAQIPVVNSVTMQEHFNRSIAFWQLVTSSPWARAIVTYSELVTDYQGTMANVCEWLGTEWNGADKPLSRMRPEMVKDRLPDMTQVWPITPAFWARDMYEILSEKEHPEGPHV